ncbi:MAG: site-specific DNA-methyltransferase [candidate division WOR-3 bacterium]|nr:site-specific DNA-methyltransferase [candidate division WOR-3 bacterium]
MAKRIGKTGKTGKRVETFRHPKAKLILRPEVGVQAQCKKKKPAKEYRFDSSLAPDLNWDGQNPAREYGQWLLTVIEKAAALPPPHQFHDPLEFKDASGRIHAKVLGLHDAIDQLKRLEKPFLNWAGKAERLSFKVPTLPLFVHERLSTKAILETLKGHKRDKQMDIDLFGDPQHSIHDQVLRAYEYPNGWVNRMILGDSLVVMNSLLEYEGMGGQVQMIYMDPPYGINYGSNFQPFIRKRDVTHNDDDDMTREPEMVKAYRDTWELGIHSYLTYLRDRLLVSRDLLHPSGSIFVQISDENVHHVRELMDEVFGVGNFIACIAFRTSIGLGAQNLDRVYDHVVWYSRDKDRAKYRQLYLPLERGKEGATRYSYVILPDGEERLLTEEERENSALIPEGARFFTDQGLTSRTGSDTTRKPFVFKGKEYVPTVGGWRTSVEGLERLGKAGRILKAGTTLRFKKFFDDFGAIALTNFWGDVGGGIQSRSDPKIYAVQTNTAVIQRCLLMTTDPGDLVLDPTFGSGTTAYVAERWGRRWIAADVSRVPLALARQRLLTATYDCYELKEPTMGPAGGFEYKRKQNKKGEEVGGIVPHVTLESIANNLPPKEEVLVDRPEVEKDVTRVTGPFVVEATIPTPVDWDADGKEDSGIAEVAEEYGAFVDRMLGILRQSPVLHIGGGKSVTLHGVRRPARSLSLSAEASVDATAEGQQPTLTEAVDEADEKAGRRLPLSRKPVAIVFGSENGSVSEKLVFEAAREAYAKSYTHLYVKGFSISPDAREMVERSHEIAGVPATWVQVTMDVTMGDLLKNMRSSQIFSVCGLPDVKLKKLNDGRYQVELLGLDVFDPATRKPIHMEGEDVPAWFLDTDYNGMCFHVCQAFFPRTSAWDSLKRELRGEYDDAVWEHLAGATSAPFEPGEHKTIAVKVIDDRGNELPKIVKLEEAE